MEGGKIVIGFGIYHLVMNPRDFSRPDPVEFKSIKKRGTDKTVNYVDPGNSTPKLHVLSKKLTVRGSFPAFLGYNPVAHSSKFALF